MTTRRLLILALVAWMTLPLGAQAPPITPPRAEPHRLLLHSLIIGGAAACGADWSTTVWVIALGRGYESNPLLAPFIRRPLLSGLMKGATCAASELIAAKQHTERPKLAYVLLSAQIATLSWAAVHNMKVGALPR